MLDLRRFGLRKVSLYLYIDKVVKINSVYQPSTYHIKH